MDLVVTDPPFFDNVHYSEIADLFFAWQQLNPTPLPNAAPTTRHPGEVHDVTPTAELGARPFSRKLSTGVV